MPDNLLSDEVRMHPLTKAAHQCLTAAECMLHCAPNFSCPFGPSDDCTSVALHIATLHTDHEAAIKRCGELEEALADTHELLGAAIDGLNDLPPDDCFQPIRTALVAIRVKHASFARSERSEP